MIYVRRCTYVYVKRTHIYTNIRFCIYVFTYVCMHACMDACMYVCMHGSTPEQPSDRHESPVHAGPAPVQAMTSPSLFRSSRGPPSGAHTHGPGQTKIAPPAARGDSATRAGAPSAPTPTQIQMMNASCAAVKGPIGPGAKGDV